VKVVDGSWVPAPGVLVVVWIPGDVLYSLPGEYAGAVLLFLYMPPSYAPGPGVFPPIDWIGL